MGKWGGGGGEIQTKKPYMGGIWIFPGTEQEIKNPHILHRGVL